MNRGRSEKDAKWWDINIWSTKRKNEGEMLINEPGKKGLRSKMKD